MTQMLVLAGLVAVPFVFGFGLGVAFMAMLARAALTRELGERIGKMAAREAAESKLFLRRGRALVALPRSERAMESSWARPAR